jgi:glyoxylase-like metal-dependent hydrolase (beta-lactamase superfamily II)
MPTEIKTFNYGRVNCYLIKADTGYIMIDTGLPTKYAAIEKELESTGCKPGNLKLIVLTHGDYDHAGNAAYLREKYGTKIAMHNSDSERVERGDWNWNLKAKPDKFPIIFRIVSFFIRPGRFDTFKPDIYVEDGQGLSEYGFDAKVLHLPGHTKGSIGILTASSELFCGDLMDNLSKPRLEFFIDDLMAANASVEKLKKLNINTVHPGHGKPFLWEQFLKNYRKKNNEEN